MGERQGANFSMRALLLPIHAFLSIVKKRKNKKKFLAMDTLRCGSGDDLPWFTGPMY